MQVSFSNNITVVESTSAINRTADAINTLQDSYAAALRSFSIPSAAAVETLSKAAAFVTSSCIGWFPKFGCALLALQPQDAEGVGLLLAPEHHALHLVALDGWAFEMHR